jgi:hypothetical protein
VGLVSVGSGYKKILFLLRLKYSKCVSLADNYIIIHVPTVEVLMKGPVLWVVVHWRLVYKLTRTALKGYMCAKIQGVIYQKTGFFKMYQTTYFNVKLGCCACFNVLYTLVLK